MLWFRGREFVLRKREWGASDEMFQSVGDSSAQDVEAGALGKGESVDGLGHGAASGFGIVVLGTEMAEPHAARFGGEMLLQGLGREAVVHVSASAGDAFAQVKRVGAVVEEFAVVVGLDHQVAGALHIGDHGFGELSGVGDEAEGGASVATLRREEVGGVGFFRFDEFDEVTVVVRRIVRNGKRRDAEIPHLERRVEHRAALQVLGDLFRHEAIAHDSLVHGHRSVDGDAEFNGERSHGFDVIRVVVGDDDRFDFGHRQSVVAHVFFEGANADAQVDENGFAARFEIVAVAGAAAAETDKLHGKRESERRSEPREPQNGKPTAKWRVKSREKLGRKMG